MKYLKTYEDYNNMNDVHIGDYVIVYKNTKYGGGKLVDVINFANNNVGHVVDEYKYLWLIKYESIPSGIKSYFVDDILKIPKQYIKHFSKNKEELEMIVNSKNYNL